MRSTSKLAREVATEEQRWLKFFKDGERLDADHLPDWMQTVETPCVSIDVASHKEPWPGSGPG